MTYQPLKSQAQIDREERWPPGAGIVLSILLGLILWAVITLCLLFWIAWVTS